MLVDHADHIGLSIDNRVRGRRVFAFSDVPVAVRSPRENVDDTLQRAMPFAAAGSFQNLRSFIFGDHTLELQQQLSPLLANIYMNRFLKYWRLTKRGEAFHARVVTYADDFVILSRGHAAEALAW